MTSAAIAAMVAALGCAGPPVDFRTFYNQNINPGTGEYWAGARYEYDDVVKRRVADAMADYATYLGLRLEACHK